MLAAAPTASGSVPRTADESFAAVADEARRYLDVVDVARSLRLEPTWLSEEREFREQAE